ncbi:MAG: bifunctional phosphoribosylaminoimidazolecarboxamide formyltransferase/IMP cyclohydrolase [Flavobacteriaceae bacterium]|nr:bifunctional phosphoribosylaminoimidazolecarboxamide formyltransferase/IMP cyclohydrolase [Flavobacteriaceae bacterium]
MSLVPIRRALLSVSDKTGVESLAKALVAQNCEIISTGGTRKKLEDAGISTTEISTVTGNPEAFGGRMKTISFNIESALLFDRDRDAEEAKSLGIEAIDLVVCNLYPFKKVMEAGADFETLIENIDIGGPTMVRSAAKNFKHVAVVVDPSDYAELVQELEANNGALSYEFRQRLMTKAFNHTADYDSMIAMAMDKEVGEQSLRLNFKGGKTLRYGENSHQAASYYREVTDKPSLADMKVLHGKALSFNNILDIHGALESIKGSTEIACSVVKHNNPCGLAEGDDQRKVMELAWAGDPISAFGSIVAFNSDLKLETVKFFDLDHEDRSKRKFVEVVIAPKVEADALAYLQKHKNLRVIELNVEDLDYKVDYRYLNGSLLAQDTDDFLHNKMESVTTKEFDAQGHKSLVEFGLRAIRSIKSNSIVLVRQHGNCMQLLGMGAGQPNRLIATKLSIEKAKENLDRELGAEAIAAQAYYERELGSAVMISDAFFPFADNVELAAAEGIRQIVQPGGSIRDKQVIEACDNLGVSMLLTGIRHFKH